MITQLEISKEKINLENKLQELIEKRKELDSLDEKIKAYKFKLINLQDNPEQYFQQEELFNRIINRLNNKSNG